MHQGIARFASRPGIDAVVLVTAAGAWGLMLGLIALDLETLVDHDAILANGGVPAPVAIGLFVVTWQLMTAAMMLPSALPMVRAFARVVQRQRRSRAKMAAFVGGYAAIWTAFAVLALLADGGLHWVVDRWAWLDQRPWLISGGLLMGAGTFQFSPLKERCLAECRSPMQFLWRHYAPGIAGSWRFGIRHGLFCVGCCWALMLIMFAVGVGSLAWMAGLTGVMLIEKTTRFGRRLVPVVGSVLIAWGALIVLRPGVALAHAGEAHAQAVSADLLLGAGVVGLVASVSVYWWRLGRSPRAERRTRRQSTQRNEGDECSTDG